MIYNAYIYAYAHINIISSVTQLEVNNWRFKKYKKCHITNLIFVIRGPLYKQQVSA